MYQRADGWGIPKNAYELLSAFDELVMLGFGEDSGIGQVNMFLHLERYDERIQEIISRAHIESLCSSKATNANARSLIRQFRGPEIDFMEE